jgi:hypothetical protein
MRLIEMARVSHRMAQTARTMAAGSGRRARHALIWIKMMEIPATALSAAVVGRGSGSRAVRRPAGRSAGGR